MLSVQGMAHGSMKITSVTVSVNIYSSHGAFANFGLVLGSKLPEPLVTKKLSSLLTTDFSGHICDTFEKQSALRISICSTYVFGFVCCVCVCVCVCGGFEI
jgi:hypothetical protein